MNLHAITRPTPTDATQLVIDWCHARWPEYEFHYIGPTQIEFSRHGVVEPLEDEFFHQYLENAREWDSNGRPFNP